MSTFLRSLPRLKFVGCNRDLSAWTLGATLSFFFAADYFRGNTSAMRLCGARRSDAGETDAGLITIGELDAGRLECTL
jgi:hypothetical protein